MSDLISRSELLNAMNTWDKFGCDCHSGLVRIDNTNNEEYVPFVHYEDMVNCVKNMPTAYDIDKVVEELEERKHEICLSDEDLEHYQNGIDNAIEIVKQGGVSDDVCKWEKGSSGYVGYPAYYSKCCATKSKGLEMQTHIIADWKYCPYCGKKIKAGEDKQIKFRQTIFKSVFDREFLEETINSNIIPNTGDYVKIGSINGRVDYKIIDYNTNDITIQIVSASDIKKSD